MAATITVLTPCVTLRFQFLWPRRSIGTGIKLHPTPLFRFIVVSSQLWQFQIVELVLRMSWTFLTTVSAANLDLIAEYNYNNMCKTVSTIILSKYIYKHIVSTWKWFTVARLTQTFDKLLFYLFFFLVGDSVNYTRGTYSGTLDVGHCSVHVFNNILKVIIRLRIKRTTKHLSLKSHIPWNILRCSSQGRYAIKLY